MATEARTVKKRGPRFVIKPAGTGCFAWELQSATGTAAAMSMYTFTRKRDAVRSIKRTCQAVMKLASGRLELVDASLDRKGAIA